MRAILLGVMLGVVGARASADVSTPKASAHDEIVKDLLANAPPPASRLRATPDFYERGRVRYRVRARTTSVGGKRETAVTVTVENVGNSPMNLPNDLFHLDEKFDEPQLRDGIDGLWEPPSTPYGPGARVSRTKRIRSTAAVGRPRWIVVWIAWPDTDGSSELAAVCVRVDAAGQVHHSYRFRAD